MKRCLDWIGSLAMWACLACLVLWAAEWFDSVWYKLAWACFMFALACGGGLMKAGAKRGAQSG